MEHIVILLDIFQQNYGTLDTALLKTISDKRTAYINSLKGPFTFGSFTLGPTSLDDVKNGIYIYITDTPELKGIKDSSGQQIKDYVVLVTLNNQNIPVQTGSPFTKNVNGMISLVTGIAYNKTANVGSGYTRVFDAFKSKIRSDLSTIITQYQTLYQAKGSASQAQQQAPAQTPKTPFIMQEETPTDQVSVSSIQGFGNVGTLPPAQQSLSDQQKAAAGSSQTNFGFDMSGGGF